MTWFGQPSWLSRIGHTRGRLVGLAIVAALPIAAMAATIAWQDYQAVARSAQDHATLLDGQSLAVYRAAVASVDNSLQAMVLRISGGRCDPASVAVGDTSVSFVTLTIDGKVACSVGAAVTIPSPPLSWFEQVRGGRSQAMARFDAEGRVALARHGDGGDVVAAVLPASWLAARALPDQLGEGEAVWLLDADRLMLASAGATADALPTMPTMGTLIGSAQTALRAQSTTGKRYAYSTTLLPGGWRLIAATAATGEHHQAVHELLVRLAELIVLLLAGLAAVVLGADVAFGHPLRRLSKAVRQWRSGAPFDPGDLRGAPDEVLQLAQSFRDATGGLQQREAELVQAQERQDLLVLEIHHRVKNNLQVIASLLNLQASRIRVPEAKAEFQAARDRVRALATLHRHPLRGWRAAHDQHAFVPDRVVRAVVPGHGGAGRQPHPADDRGAGVAHVQRPGRSAGADRDRGRHQLRPLRIPGRPGRARRSGPQGRGGRVGPGDQRLTGSGCRPGGRRRIRERGTASGCNSSAASAASLAPR